MSALPRVLPPLAIVAFVATAAAEQVYEYRFEPTAEHAFGFGGGLLGGREEAVVAGSFEITVHEDGTATLTRFDATANAALDLPRAQSSGRFSPGGRLADMLFVDPVGAPAAFARGRRDVSFLMQSPVETGVSPAAMIESGDAFPQATLSDPAETRIAISGLGDAEVWVQITSSPELSLDQPTFFTTGPGLLAVLVPEPAAVTMLGLLLLASGAPRRR